MTEGAADVSAIVADVGSTEMAGEATQGQTSGQVHIPSGDGQEEVAESDISQEQATESREDLDFARRFNSLTRRERQIVQRETEIKEKLSKVSEWESDRQMIKDNPLEYMEKNGWTFKQLADLVMNDGKPSAETRVERLERELAEMKEKDKQKKQEDEDNEKTSNVNKTIENFKTKITEHVQADQEKYEYINQYNAMEMVYDVIEQYHNANKEILSIDKAAEEVEKYLETHVEKASSTKKFKSKFTKDLEDKKEAEGAGAEIRAQTTTLTNSDAAGTAQTRTTDRYLSDDESKAAAADFLRRANSNRK